MVQQPHVHFHQHLRVCFVILFVQVEEHCTCKTHVPCSMRSRVQMYSHISVTKCQGQQCEEKLCLNATRCILFSTVCSGAHPKQFKRALKKITSSKEDPQQLAHHLIFVALSFRSSYQAALYRSVEVLSFESTRCS